MLSYLDTLYSVVWKYKIKPEQRQKFESEYGKNGTWSKLFSKSEGYKDSFLHKSEDEKDTYLLVDTWVNKESYEAFKTLNQQTYDQISEGFEHLYNVEEKLGTFNLVL